MAKTGIHIKRANIGSVEAHNLRTAEYLAGLEKAGRSIYFFQDQTHLNRSWVNPTYRGKSCAKIQEELIELYRQKVGQKPQLQDRTRVNKKTGKEYQVAGWSPIREGVIPVKESTTLDDFKPIKDWAESKGLNIIRIDIHQDEGYRNEATGVTKHNRHAHVVFDWVDHATGKTLKLDEKDMSEFQDIVADSLQMERGTKKEESGLNHIDHIEYREQKAEQHTFELEKKIEQQGKEIEELREEAKDVHTRTEIAISRLNDIQEDITTTEETKAKLEQITGELEETLKETAEQQKKTYAQIEEQHTKKYLWGMIKGSPDYAAVAEELWQQQRDGENSIVRNDFLQVRKYKEERDNAVRERNEAVNNLQAMKGKYAKLKERIVDVMGERFQRFWEDMKRYSKDFIMAIGLWHGEVWENTRLQEKYTADKDRCLLLINGKSQDEREAEFVKLARQVHKRAVETSGEGWALMRFQKLAKMTDYHEKMRELKDIANTAERGQRRGMSR